MTRFRLLPPLFFLFSQKIYPHVGTLPIGDESAMNHVTLSAIHSLAARLFLVLWLSFGLVFVSTLQLIASNFVDIPNVGAVTTETDGGNKGCVRCHTMPRSTRGEHIADCSSCHGGNAESTDKTLAHNGLRINPADLNHVGQTCARCHLTQVRRFESSLHGTVAGEIAISRWFAGAVQSLEHEKYSILGSAFPKLPKGTPRPEHASDLIDDLLRRRCLRCHPSTLADERDRGCMACHRPTRMANGQSRHDFLTPQSCEPCLTCHRDNWAGSEFLGDYKSDRGRMYGPADKTLQLLPDIHATKGLICTDCHPGRQVMGDGTAPAHAAIQSPPVTCKTCHDINLVDRPNTGPTITRKGNNRVLHSKLGRDYIVPLYRETTPGHSIALHANVRCEACHAAWVAGDYGLNMIRVDIADYYRWAYLLPQGFRTIDELFQRNLARSAVLWELPMIPDLLEGTIERGMWLQAWDVKRFELMLIGTDGQGRLGILRPFCQFALSFVDGHGQVIVDNATIEGGFDRVTPHTTRRDAWNCERCHGNAGWWDHTERIMPERWYKLAIPSGLLTPDTKLLPDDIRQRLRSPSTQWRLHRSMLPPFAPVGDPDRELADVDS